MNKKHFALLLAITALGAFLRFHWITDIPPGLYPDEAMNGNNALEALATGDFKIFYPENNGREGLFINIQALSVAAFGNTPWALRMVSALVGTLTILGAYLLAAEMLKSKTAGLLAGFFIATSYWHLNFSRIGFRAIMLPLMTSLAMYFLLRGLRTGNRAVVIAGGALAGLGFHTYIAYRFMVLVALVPIAWHLWEWHKEKRDKKQATRDRKISTPYAILLFLGITFLTALPIGIYFLRHPQDFSNRAGDISIFSAASPIREFGVSALKTAGMFFVSGDCNWRHNYDCAPALHPLVAALFFLGIIAALRAFWKKDPDERHAGLLTLVWLAFMALPAVLTREGLPHALRAIGMIPPVMVLASWGAISLGRGTNTWIGKQKEKWPRARPQLSRISRELALFSILALILVPLAAYRTYFLSWGQNVNTYDAFDTSSWHLGQFLAGVKPDVKKYVAVNVNGTLVRGIPMPAQTIMFATDTFREQSRQEKNMTYLVGPDIPKGIIITPDTKVVIAIINGLDSGLIQKIKKDYPELRERAPGDFVILQNY